MKIFPAFLVIAPLWQRVLAAWGGSPWLSCLGSSCCRRRFTSRASRQLYVQLEQVLIGPALGWGRGESLAPPSSKNTRGERAANPL